MKRGYIEIIVPGFRLRGNFPLFKLRELTNFAVSCIRDGTLVPYNLDFAIWQKLNDN